jgi:UDP-2-acetamido-3-amino-2,3-dideoxy-glucuronate N-acetyltransferase
MADRDPQADEPPFIHPQALCESTSIGGRTRIWAFAHVLPGATIGADCNICDGVFVESDVVVGDRVTVKCGVQLWDGVRLEDDVFVGPNATFTNDLRPRSRQHPERFLETVVHRGASIGANATILPGITIGRGSMVGAGAVVTRDVPPNAKVVGNPARVSGYVSDAPLPALSVTGVPAAVGALPAAVAGVTVHRLRVARDLRGSLAAGELAADVPFPIRRFFTVFDVPSNDVRGEHAHRTCHQFLICVAGSVEVLVDDGTHRQHLTLDDPSLAVYMPPLTWGTQFHYSPDAVLLVFASDPYDADDYIRSYEEFLALVGPTEPGA